MEWYQTFNDNLANLIFWTGLQIRQPVQSSQNFVLGKFGNLLKPSISEILRTQNKINSVQILFKNFNDFLGYHYPPPLDDIFILPFCAAFSFLKKTQISSVCVILLYPISSKGRHKDRCSLRIFLFFCLGPHSFKSILRRNANNISYIIVVV